MNKIDCNPGVFRSAFHKNLTLGMQRIITQEFLTLDILKVKASKLGLTATQVLLKVNL